MRDLCTARERTRFCNVIISLFCGVVRIFGVTGFCSSFLNCNIKHAIGRVTGITHSLLARKILDLPNERPVTGERNHIAY